MRYAGLILNDITAAPGLCVSLFTQGCPHRCPGCHNSGSWDFDGGEPFTPEVLDQIINGLTAQGIQRDLCIMGGEPLCPENIALTDLVIQEVKHKVPNAKIHIWTGYIYEDLMQRMCPMTAAVLAAADTLIDGPYIEELRDITLSMRGSTNQRIIELTK
jgi:anaerobic ribonucleoside-triphosphate reductase activating protein